jgi:dipeptidyl aminopeptidase/acylaminoacyl peptidase
MAFAAVLRAETVRKPTDEIALSFTKMEAQGPPPLIDRELIFGNTEIAQAEISPNGKYLTFGKSYQGTLNIFVKKIQEPLRTARLLTAYTRRPIHRYFWTYDSKYVLYLNDEDGSGNFNLHAVEPEAEADARTGCPPSRDLTNLRGVRVEIYNFSACNPDVVHVGLNDRDKAWHDLYRLNVSTGERALLHKNTERISAWIFDSQGNLRLVCRSAENGRREVLRVEGGKLTRIYSCSALERCEVIRFCKYGNRVYIVTNKGCDLDLAALMMIDPVTGKTEFVESDPLKRVDFGVPIFSNATDEIAYTSYEDDGIRRYFRDRRFEADFKWLTGRLPGKNLYRISATRDEHLWLIAAKSDTEPGEVYLFDRPKQELTLQFRRREKLPRYYLANMKPVVYKSSDEFLIPAYLTLPKGRCPKNLPVIVFPHDGPWSRDVWGYDAHSQFFANRGYAVLSMNFRGSAGYGKKFMDAGDNEWGRRMQEDVTCGVRYLIDEGIADPNRVGIFGLSYGGYAALAGVAFTPTVYAAAVALFGPSNLLTLLSSLSPYHEPERQVLYKRIGDPTNAQGRARLIERSPLNSAANIKTPLMIAHGVLDNQVNRHESDQIMIALRHRPFPVKYLLVPDEGHGFARPLNKMAVLLATEMFFSKYLGGNCQSDGAPEVMARLKEITVDLATVGRDREHIDKSSK